MDISVVLATYDRDDILVKTLDSFERLALQGVEWQCLVVDNACRGATRALVQRYSEVLPITYFEEPKPGKNNALMAAMPHAQGELIVFTDDDVVVDSAWLSSLWHGAQRLPKFDLFGGRILPLFPGDLKPEKGIDLSKGFTKSAYVIADWDLPEGEIRPGNIWGPNMAVRRRVFEAGYTFNRDIGPSQSSTYTMGSETEFLLRVAEAGYRSAYIPSALVHHQIRPEQLSIKWLKGRAIRHGKGKAALLRDFDRFPKLFGVPRFLYRKLATLSALSLFYRLIGDKASYYDQRIELGIYQGVYKHYRESGGSGECC